MKVLILLMLLDFVIVWVLCKVASDSDKND